MKNLIFGPGGRLGQALATALGAMLLAGCQSKNPVTVGQQIASRLCQQHDEVVALDYRADEQLIAELKAGTIKTHAQYQARRQQLKKPVYRRDSLNATVVTASLAELETDFARPDDQALAAKQVVRLVDHCDSVSQAQRRPRLPFHELMAHLTGPDPTQQPGPGGMMPPKLTYIAPDSAAAAQPSPSTRP